MDNKTLHILEILEKEARISHDEIATLTGISVDEVSSRIQQLEKSGVIRGYKAIIDWDIAGEDYVYAIIELKIRLERKTGYKAITERLYKYPQVRSIRLLSGQSDISLTVRGRSMKEVAFFVAEKIATLEQVQSTSSHFVLKTYKEDGVILYEPEQLKRLPVSL